MCDFYFPDTEKKKKAVVQWFVRVCEIPQNKRKLLSRDPHPQEIFYYQDPSCDSEVDAETILGTVQVCANVTLNMLNGASTCRPSRAQ